MLSDLERELGYTFREKRLLENALTHSSYANEKWKNSLASNERLEFLGDSILGFVVAEYMYRKYPDHPEGDLTRMRAPTCSARPALAQVPHGWIWARTCCWGWRGAGRRQNTQQHTADAVESVIAAAYLDGGFQAAKGIVDRLILSDVPKGGRATLTLKRRCRNWYSAEKIRSWRIRCWKNPARIMTRPSALR